MQTLVQRQPSYHHHQHLHDGTFHLNFREMQRGTSSLVPYKGDHWQCQVASPLNDLLITLCRSWRYTNRPIVTSRPMAWPLISRIDMRDSSVFDMMSPASMEQLHAYVRKNGVPSCFGKIHETSGAADMYDERIRQSLEISAQKIFAIRDTDLYKVATRILRTYWGLDSCSLRFYKMLMYDSIDAGHFEFHRDSVHDERHVATLVISLESPDCRGGDVVFNDFSADELVRAGVYRPEDMLKICIFYTDTEHRVEPVTRGHRILLEYDVIVDTRDEVRDLETDKYHYDTELTRLFQSDDEPLGDVVDDEAASPITLRTFDLFNEREMDESVAEKICLWLKNASVSHIPALMMSHLYPIANVEPDTLRGFDRLLYKVLDKSFEIEFMPVSLYAAEKDCVTRCVSLHRNRNHHEKRDLVLFVTPTPVHCTNSLHGAYMGGNDRPAPHLNYTACAMILNKITKM